MDPKVLKDKKDKSLGRAITAVVCSRLRIKNLLNHLLKEDLIATRLNPPKDIIYLSKENANHVQVPKTETR
jgi:hypothetical protein